MNYFACTLGPPDIQIESDALRFIGNPFYEGEVEVLRHDTVYKERCFLGAHSWQLRNVI